MKEKIHLFYTSDLHSSFDNWPKIVSFLKRGRRKYESQGEFTLTFDNGDHIDRVNSVTEATMGKANVRLLNKAAYDVITLGNNEGMTLGYNDLYHLYDKANFSVVCSNLKSLRGEGPDWLLPYKIFKTPSGINIGVFGLTARFNPYYNLLGWDALAIDQVIQNTLKTLRQEADVIVLLSHLGLNEDYAIAESYSSIDVIIGGHTHHLFREGEVVNHAVLTAVGKHGAFAGEVTINYDHSKKQVVSKEAYAVPMETFEADEATQAEINGLKSLAFNKMNKVIAHLDAPPEVNWFKETPLMQNWTDYLKAYTQADLAMLNSGLLVKPFENDIITYLDVHEVCPHPINPVVVEITGDALIEVIRQARTEQFKNIELKGFGFRGKILGEMVFSGINLPSEINQIDSNYVQQVYLDDGRRIERKEIYKVATGDLFTFGRMLTPIARAEKKRLILPEFIRALLIETIKKMESK